MGEVVRFVPKSERERARLIREARAIDDVFPRSDTVREQEKASACHVHLSVGVHRGEEVPL
jgi:hypothetical protein